MIKILGYGEDAFTLWALKHRTSKILEAFKEQTAPSDCLIFYRPSFGRHSKKGSGLRGNSRLRLRVHSHLLTAYHQVSLFMP